MASDALAPEIAHVLFMDIVSYSALPMDRQNQAIGHLQDLVQGLAEFQQSQASDRLISLPTGDGMALAFFGDVTLPVRCARRIAIALRQGDPGYYLRMGIHTGSIYRRADINAGSNVAGGGINFAQRVMDCGDGGHVLVSKAYAENLDLSGWKDSLHDLGEVEVKHGVRVHVFNVYNEEFGNRHTPAKILARKTTGDGPNLGRLVSKMCDRRAQEEEFRDRFLDALDRQPGAPQAFLILGEEGQCHESLVQRLVDRVERSLPPRAAASGGRVKKVPWQHEGELAQRLSRQIYSLFENLGPSGGRQPFHAKDRSAAAFSILLGASLNSYIAVHHEVHASRWDGVTGELLKGYLKFWSDIPRSVEQPVVVVFLSVIAPRPSGARWRKLLPVVDAETARRKKIRRELDEIERGAGIPCRALAELPAVTREDVLEWFSLNHIYDSEDKRLRALNRLFPNGVLTPKAMSEIETFCAEELRKFAAEEDAALSGDARRSAHVQRAAAVFG